MGESSSTFTGYWGLIHTSGYHTQYFDRKFITFRLTTFS